MILKKTEFKKIVNKLKKKFSVEERHTGHWHIIISYKGHPLTRTKCSEGRDDIPPIWANKIKKRLNFSSDEEFRDFIKCPMTCEDYLNLMKARDVL